MILASLDSCLLTKAAYARLSAGLSRGPAPIDGRLPPDSNDSECDLEGADACWPLEAPAMRPPAELRPDFPAGTLTDRPTRTGVVARPADDFEA